MYTGSCIKLKSKIKYFNINIFIRNLELLMVELYKLKQNNNIAYLYVLSTYKQGVFKTVCGMWELFFPM